MGCRRDRVTSSIALDELASMAPSSAHDEGERRAAHAASVGGQREWTAANACHPFTVLPTSLHSRLCTHV